VSSACATFTHTHKHTHTHTHTLQDHGQITKSYIISRPTQLDCTIYSNKQTRVLSVPPNKEKKLETEITIVSVYVSVLSGVKRHSFNFPQFVTTTWLANKITGRERHFCHLI